MRGYVAIGLLAVSLIAHAFELSAEEKARIVSHGPWPPAPRHDATNPVSGEPAAIALGKRLFFDPRLSGTGSVLCASCHEPFRQFQDGRARGFGLEEVDRNTPTLLNVGLYRRYGWDGAHDSLWSQSLRPLLEAREMRSTPAHVAALLREHYAGDYQRAFGAAVPQDDQAAMVDAGRALAAFQETLVSGRTPFDEFRDALVQGDVAAAARYPAAAQRGAALFVGRAGCESCHSGAHFTDGAISGGYRVPGLRNVALTAPYMHDGRYPTLSDVLRMHAPAPLDAGEREDIIAFLRSLTESSLLK